VTSRSGDTGRRTADLDIDLTVDLNAQDDGELGWSTFGDARDPSHVRPGVMLLAGNLNGRAVARVTAVDQDGQVHFIILPPVRSPRTGTCWGARWPDTLPGWRRVIDEAFLQELAGGRAVSA